MPAPQDNIKNIEKFNSKINHLFDVIVDEVIRLGLTREDLIKNNKFSFDNLPGTKRIAKQLFAELGAELTKELKSQIAFSFSESDKRLQEFMKERGIPGIEIERLNKVSNSAILQFQNRRVNGLGLSDRVWQISSGFKSQIENTIGIAIQSGMDSRSLARQLKPMLKEPDKLFRRVRNDKGILRLSQAAKEFNPGQGTYRSSYKNAHRLARTEINMGYNQAANNRYKTLDFIVGVQIRLSHSHTDCDVCDKLKGKYPKDFVFNGWHPQCMCHSIPIMKTRDEMSIDAERVKKGLEPLPSVNEVKDIPDFMKSWINTNKDRLYRMKELPYFVSDNNLLG